MSSIASTIQAPIDKVTTLWDKIKDFGGWLKENILKIDIDFPELPEWAQFGSPLKLHHKLLDFNKFLRSTDLEVKLNMPDIQGEFDNIPTQAAITANERQRGNATQAGQRVYNFSEGAIKIEVNSNDVIDEVSFADFIADRLAEAI